ncbi:MAG: hypothetical protein OSJ83_05910 [Clostridia bacterium]|nr:hypothetical protein [Clostridia bacterium]
MRATFERFIDDNPTCSKFKDNRDARRIFDIINKQENILRMMEVSEFGKPALSACVKEIEDYCESDSNTSIDLNDEFTRKAVGRMVKTVLAPYGYMVERQRDIPQKAGAKYFSTASCYVFAENSGNLRMVINDDIMEVRRGNELFSNMHLRFTIEFRDDDCYQTKCVIINGREYDLKIKYPYRSQGNAHLIFLSEGGVWFGLSFDGHKGDMFVNSNSIISYLVKILNADLKSEEDWGWDKKEDTVYHILESYNG